jgi:hypothetical protein
LVVLHESLATLPPQQQEPLTDAVQAALATQSANEVLQPGEAYLGNDGVVHRADRAFIATVHFRLLAGVPGLRCQLNPRTMAMQLCLLDGEDCAQLCSAPWTYRAAREGTVPAQPSVWEVFVAVQTSWTYTVVASQDARLGTQQPGLRSSTSDAVQLTLLRVSWNGSNWHAEADVSPYRTEFLVPDSSGMWSALHPVCGPALDLFVSHQDLSRYFWVRIASGASPAAGCAITASVTSETENGSDALYLERFGVLLAANDVAHYMRPELPRANAFEQNLAQQLASGPA